MLVPLSAVTFHSPPTILEKLAIGSAIWAVFRAGQGPVMKAVSIPLHIGRTTMVWQTTIRNPDGKVAAIVTQTQIVIPARDA